MRRQRRKCDRAERCGLWAAVGNKSIRRRRKRHTISARSDKIRQHLQVLFDIISGVTHLFHRNNTYLTLLKMSTIEGREDGSRFQHDKQRFHHSSVIREHVDLTLGRSGTPCEILTMTLIGFGLEWNGTLRVNISCIGSSELLGKSTKDSGDTQALSFQTPRHLLQQLHAIRQTRDTLELSMGVSPRGDTRQSC